MSQSCAILPGRAVVAQQQKCLQKPPAPAPARTSGCLRGFRFIALHPQRSAGRAVFTVAPQGIPPRPLRPRPLAHFALAGVDHSAEKKVSEGPSSPHTRLAHERPISRLPLRPSILFLSSPSPPSARRRLPPPTTITTSTTTTAESASNRATDERPNSLLCCSRTDSGAARIPLVFLHQGVP